MNKTIRISDLIPEIYHPVYNSKKRHQVFKGGRSSVKGTTFYTKIVEGLNANPNSLAYVFVPLQKNVRGGCHNEVKKVCNRMSIPYQALLSPFEVRFDNGSIIKFTGLDDGEKSKTLTTESDDQQLMYVLFDEIPNLKDRQIIRDTVNTFVREDPIFLYVGNPPKNKKHWWFDFCKEMENRDDSLILHTDYTCIPKHWKNVEAIYNEAEQTKKLSQIIFEHEWLGLAVGQDGLFFTMFDKEKHIIQNTKGYKLLSLWIGIDYGEYNATTFGLTGIFKKDGLLYSIDLDSWYYSGRDNQKELGVSRYADHFDEWYQKLKIKYKMVVSEIIIDPSAVALRIAIEEKGYNLTLADNERVNGWKRMKNLMLSGRYLILEGVDEEQIDELELAEYDTKTIDISKPSGEDLIKENDHCLDRKRYVINRIYEYFKLIGGYKLE